jgi:two-component system, OmpR family, sensor histidine kinase SenX3
VAVSSKTPRQRKAARARPREREQGFESPARSEDKRSYFQPDLVALLAHQLVTPVSTIITLAQSLSRRADEIETTGVRDRADRIRQAGQRLMNLIESIMDRARADAGVIKISPRAFDPRAVALRICQAHRSNHPNRHFIFHVESLPASMVGDPVLLEQVVAILLSNAIKYSPADRPITVSAFTRNDGITLTIKDQGMGIPSEDLPYLAKPFFRASNARSTPGTGLGLSLARHILDLHGGRLNIESQEARGTAVTIFVPTKPDLSLGEGI